MSFTFLNENVFELKYLHIIKPISSRSESKACLLDTFRAQSLIYSISLDRGLSDLQKENLR